MATTENIPRLIVETTAVAETGKIFFVFTYLLEGIDPLVLEGYIKISNLQSYIDAGSRFGLKSTTRKRCQQAANLVEDLCRVNQNLMLCGMYKWVY